MLVPLLACVAVAHLDSQIKTVELFRGARVASVSPRYWAVEDTTLEATEGDLDHGWQPELYGADGKNILIQFRDLNRVLGPHKHIRKASLVLSIVAGERVAFLGAREVLVPWHDGPNKTLMALTPEEPAQGGAKWAATWRHSRAGTDAKWAHAGGTGEADSKPIAEAKAKQPGGDLVAIDGLESAVQRQYDRPFDNHGFLLTFDAPIEFESSKSDRHRPKLVLEVEDAPAATGPDLSVTYIERSPEYERYQTEGGTTVQTQDGQPVGVPDHVLNGLTKKWPADGESLTYVAHVKNVGDTPSSGFRGQWYVDEKPGSGVDKPDPIAPGAETTVTIQLPYRNLHADHRFKPIGFKIEPKGPDAVVANNFLEIQESALSLAVRMEKTFYENASRMETATGSHSPEDWIEQEVGMLNDLYFPYSKFSFATDGVIERVRVQRIEIVPDGSLQGPLRLPNGRADFGCDAEFGFLATDSPAFHGVDAIDFLKLICLRLGLADPAIGSYPAGDPRIQIPGFTRGTEDLFAGLMGGGDTRDDAALPRTFSVPYQPYSDEVADLTRMEATDLLSSSDVAGLNGDLGKRSGHPGEYLYDTPSGVLLNVYDYNGKKIEKANLSFYQMVNGKFTPSTPSFVLNSGKGSVVLPKRETLCPSPVTTVSGHVLRPSPFGRIDVGGSNGAFLVRAEKDGITEWSVLKLWQLVSTFHRGQKAIALMGIAFNLPADPLESGTNVAKGATASDSANDASASLASLFDGRGEKEVELPSKPASWLEIDLGRDRTIGELRLIGKDRDFWSSFDIATYSTGEKARAARAWSKEVNWSWSVRNRGDRGPTDPSARAVAYRGPSRRFRFIRIIAKETGDSAKLLQIEAIPIKQAGEGGG